MSRSNGWQDEMPAYKYQPLQQREIRLIELHKASYDSDIWASIIYVRLDEAPSYFAISYVWGPPVFSHPLAINDNGRPAVLWITKSLWDALKDFSANGHADDGKTPLWADAICINQHDTAERNRQVAIMDRIFAQASWVLISLGQSSENDIIVSWAMQCLEDWTQFERNDHGWPKCPFPDFFRQQRLAAADAAKNGLNPGLTPARLQQLKFEDCIQHLSELLDRPWFHRMWVRQEFGLARDATFFSGSSRRFSRAAFHSIDLVLNSYPEYGTNRYGGHVQRMCWELVQTFWAPAERKPDPRERFLRFLFATRTLKTSEPLDRIYALRAMAGLADCGYLYPNYAITPELLWRDVCEFLLSGLDVSRNPDVQKRYAILAMPAVQRSRQAN